MAKCILGIDEVGRGPWAGPLVVGAVILGEDFAKRPEYAELRDSKKLAKKKREKLATIIQEKSVSYSLGWVTASKIDRYGLGPALKLAARRAVKQVLAQKIKFDNIIIDGSINLLAGTPLEDRINLLPKADDLVKEVSAASIIAKVARDQYMTDLAEKYPEYGFESHVGYGTAKHREALEKYGICPEHRQSFRPIAKIIEKMPPKGLKLSRIEQKHAEIGRENHIFGHQAELSAANYLCKENHQIVARNYKTKTYEIDLISIKDQTIYFTEVKYRQDPKNGDPLEQITPAKLQKMHYAAEKFLQTHPEFQGLGPKLAAIGVIGKNFIVDEFIDCS